MPSTFQCEYCQCLHSNYAIKFLVKCTSHGGMYDGHNVITVNIVTRTFGRFVGQVCLEISRYCGESILMKVSEIIIYIMKIMS